jgi:redox-sensitive bicupin YhaK (pirin superfamily)
MLAHQLETQGRKVIFRTRGRTHGAITRLASPSDVGELIKPFVFLDSVAFDGRLAPTPMAFGWHPHSGIATVTVLLEGGIRFAETTGRDGSLPAGGIEWMRASNGVWHTGEPEPGRVKAFQLWVALPPELENAHFASDYVMPKDVPVDGPARIILGEYGNLKSPLAAPPMTYLSVSLAPGERWTYQPPRGHDVAWVAVHEGTLRASSTIPAGEIAVFDRSEKPIDFQADGRTGFVMGSAAKHPHDLVLGRYSVHTSTEALRRGETEIRRVGGELRAKGVI